MSILSRLITAFRDTARGYVYNPDADTEESWTQEDAKWLSEVISSNRGQRLSARLTNYVIKQAVSATYSNDTRAPAIARGVALGIKALETHAQVKQNFASLVRNTGKIEEEPQEDVAASLALQ